MHCPAGEALRDLLIDAMLCYIASTGQPCISMLEFEATVDNIAYVLIGPPREGWSNSLTAVRACCIVTNDQMGRGPTGHAIAQRHACC